MIFKVFVFKKTVTICLFNSANIRFFVIVSVFTFTFMNLLSKIVDKIQ